MTEIDPRLSDLYREAATETPPATVDAAILAAARQRLAAPRRRPQTWWSRWRIPVSLTATLVLGVSLGLLVEREHPERLRGDLAGPVPAQSEPTPGAETKAVTAEADGAPAAPDRVEPARRRAAPPAAASEAESGPAPAPAPMQASTAAPAMAERYPAEAASQATTAKAARESSLAADSAASLGAAGMAAPQAPEPWLDAIRQLRRTGRAKEAAEQLAQFRRAYPDYAIPEDLAR